jgi:hypothetical protein
VPLVHTTLIGRLIHSVSWLFLTSRPPDARIPVEDDGDKIVSAIVDAAAKLIERKTTEKSPKQFAKLQAGSHAQSTTSRVYDSVLHNTLSDRQQFPARPREFRRQLQDPLQKIGSPELSDVLASLASTGLLIHKCERFPIPRGAQGKNSYLAEETRGVRSSYYEPSAVKKMVDRVLADETMLNKLTGRLIQSDLLYKLIRYANCVLLHQARLRKQSVFNTYATAGLSEARTRLNAEGVSQSRLILVRDLTDQKIEALADAYAEQEIQRYETDPHMVLYRLVAILTVLGLSGDTTKSVC